jgi:hypothetical protein
MGKVHTLKQPRKATPTDDLLCFLEAMVRKAEREPETAAKSLEHAKRAFDRIVERIA